MGSAQLDVAIRLGGITTILLLAWLLFGRRREVGMAAWLFLPLALCLSGFLLGNTPTVPLRLSGIAGAAAHFASGLTVVFLWWFCLSCFDSGFKLRGGPLVIGMIWAVLAALDRGLLGPAPADKGLSYVLIGLGFAIVGHMIWRLAAERPGDLIQRRHDARVMVAILLGGQLLIDLSVDVLYGVTWRPFAFAAAQNLAIFGFGLWLARRLLAVRLDVLTFGGAPRRTPLASAGTSDAAGAGEDALRRRLGALIETQRIFLDPDLTFAAFAQRMEAPERSVRTLVNRELGFDHFRAFLNHYRMAEARRLLADPRRSGDKLIAIALDSGFASLASFNRVFRAGEGCTPSQYRDTALADRPRPHAAEKVAEPAPAPGFEERSGMF